MAQQLAPPPPQLDHEAMAAYVMPIPRLGQQVEYYLTPHKSRNVRVCVVVEVRQQDIRVASIDTREPVSDEWICFHTDPRLRANIYLAKRGCWGFLQSDIDREQLEFELRNLIETGMPKLLAEFEEIKSKIRGNNIRVGQLEALLKKFNPKALAEAQVAGAAEESTEEE